MVVIARPERWDGPFMPNLIVAVDPVDEPWLAYVDRSTTALVNALATPLLIDARIEEDRLRLIVGHELFGRRLTLVQGHAGANGRAAVASYTVADVDWPTLSGQILASVSTLRAAT